MSLAKDASSLHAGDAFAGGGDMGVLMRDFDWSGTRVGDVEGWHPSLRTSVSIALNSPLPIAIWWGREYTQLYNDSFRAVLGPKHPHSLGRSGKECWSELWDVAGPMFDSVFENGQAATLEDFPLILNRHLPREECYFTFHCSPILEERGEAVGIFCTLAETTTAVISEKRVRLLRDLAEGARHGRTEQDACEHACETLGRHGSLIPLALIYLLDAVAGIARLAASAARINLSAEASPTAIDLSDSGAAWPLAEAASIHLPLGPWLKPLRFGSR